MRHTVIREASWTCPRFLSVSCSDPGYRIIRLRKLAENHYTSGVNMRLDGNADATDVRRRYERILWSGQGRRSGRRSRFSA